jgi:hypothetical protein
MRARTCALVLAVVAGVPATAALAGAAAPAIDIPPRPGSKIPSLGGLGNLPCSVAGDARANVIVGRKRAAEILCGGGGGDRIHAGPGDIVLAGGGNDLILARNGRVNVVNGGAGRDRARLDRIDSRSSVETLLR